MQLPIYQCSFVTFLENLFLETEVEDRKILIKVRQLCESLLIAYQDNRLLAPLG